MPEPEQQKSRLFLRAYPHLEPRVQGGLKYQPRGQVEVVAVHDEAVCGLRVDHFRGGLHKRRGHEGVVDLFKAHHHQGNTRRQRKARLAVIRG